MAHRRWFRGVAEYDKPGSLANYLRLRRFDIFRELVGTLTRPVRIIDLGGTQQFWLTMNLFLPEEVDVTVINVTDTPTTLPNFRGVIGDARDVSHFGDNAFDLTFSNSVLEHVGTWADQQKMAREMLRLAPRLFLQTPNRYFPIEPHWQLPLMQFLPSRMAYFVGKHYGTPGYGGLSHSEIRTLVSCRLLSRDELVDLFPNANILKEKLFGLTKSYMVHQGFGRSAAKPPPPSAPYGPRGRS